MIDETTDRAPGPELVILGHVTRDLIHGGVRLGGAASFAARAASVLGIRAGVVTSAPPDSPLLQQMAALPGVEVRVRPSEHETTFSHAWVDGRRQLSLLATADRLRPDDVPAPWRRAAVVYVGPVAGECGRDVIDMFETSFIAAGIQGWLRTTGPGQAVMPAVMAEVHQPPSGLRAVILSIEDHPEAARLGVELAARGLLVAITRGSAGSTVLTDGAQLEIAAAPAQEQDPTGAGDVFGLVLALALARGARPDHAGALAALAAARTVEGPGIGNLARFDASTLRPPFAPVGSPPGRAGGNRIDPGVVVATRAPSHTVDREAGTKELPAFPPPTDPDDV